MRWTSLFLILLLGAYAHGQDETFNEFLRDIDPETQAEQEIPEVEEQDEPEEPEEGGETPAYPAPQVQLLQITQTRNPRLQMHPTLMASAQALADYHAASGRWGHSSRSWRPNASENIAWNADRSVTKLGHQWITSRKGHRQNWDSSWTYVGVGVAYSSGRVYGVQHFSNSPTSFNGTPTLQGVGSRSYRRGGILRRVFSRRRR